MFSSVSPRDRRKFVASINHSPPLGILLSIIVINSSENGSVVKVAVGLADGLEVFILFCVSVMG